MNLVYSDESKKRIRSLHPEIKKGIRQVLEAVRENPYAGKPLQKELAGFWSVPFKNYRIIYKPLENENKLRIYTLGRRKDIYENFARSLTKGKGA